MHQSNKFENYFPDYNNYSVPATLTTYEVKERIIFIIVFTKIKFHAVSKTLYIYKFYTFVNILNGFYQLAILDGEKKKTF